MGNRLLQRFVPQGEQHPRPLLKQDRTIPPGQPGARLPGQPRIRQPGQRRKIQLVPPRPSLPRSLLRYGLPPICDALATSYAGNRLAGVLAAEFCKQAGAFFFPDDPGSIRTQPYDIDWRQPSSPGSRQIPREDGGQGGPRGRGQPPGRDGGQPGGRPNGQRPGGDGGEVPPPGSGPPTPEPLPPGGGNGGPTGEPWFHPLTGFESTSYPGFGLPPPIALAGPGVQWAWDHGLLAWDPVTGTFWADFNCAGPVCSNALPPGSRLVLPRPAGR